MIAKQLYHYNLNCELVNKKSGEVIKKFKAREISGKERGSGYVFGGIASLGQGYVIATAELEKVDVQPINHKVIIEGQSFAVASLAVSQIGAPCSRRYFIEKILRLE